MENFDKVLKIAELIQAHGTLVAAYEGGAELSADEWACAEALAAGPEVDLSFVVDPNVKWPGRADEETPKGGERR